MPGLHDEDTDQAAIKPQLHDRITTVLLMTPRADAAEHGPSTPHGKGGHTYDGRCALCTGDTDALTEALLHAFTATVLPPEPNTRLRALT
ncbi:hypothetical protein GCM10010121_095430 [Streptomyces brasiliensis]|uniref:Uncharacterized protein n=1 Tax=Streptomyces brasiliensis TaxID=1954 RepID=A0A917UMX6_9ACTN|nr:hypothetical protein GCM10010121_095430 [Streptomyces brasiliensis]